MNKQTFVKALKDVPKMLKKHSPELLTGIGIAGMIFTTITAVKATPKALRLVDEQEIKEGKRLTNSEIIKTTWKCYVPAAVTGMCSIGQCKTECGPRHCLYHLRNGSQGI